MSKKKKLFMKIFRAELEDLDEDIQNIENKYKEKMESQEIGNYVYLENEAFLLHEAECVSRISANLDTIDITGFDSVKDLVDAMRKDIHRMIQKFEYPVGVERLINRKIDKVDSYIESLSD